MQRGHSPDLQAEHDRTKGYLPRPTGRAYSSRIHVRPHAGMIQQAYQCEATSTDPGTSMQRGHSPDLQAALAASRAHAKVDLAAQAARSVEAFASAAHGKRKRPPALDVCEPAAASAAPDATATAADLTTPSPQLVRKVRDCLSTVYQLSKQRESKALVPHDQASRVL